MLGALGVRLPLVIGRRASDNHVKYPGIDPPRCSRSIVACRSASGVRAEGGGVACPIPPVTGAGSCVGAVGAGIGVVLLSAFTMSQIAPIAPAPTPMPAAKPRPPSSGFFLALRVFMSEFSISREGEASVEHDNSLESLRDEYVIATRRHHR